MKRIAILAFLAILVFVSCKPDSKEKDKPQAPREVIIPTFNQDSAYAYVQKQVNFGPRVPGTDAHTACGEWLAEKLTSFGAKVTKQPFKAQFFTGEPFQATNIIGSYNPDKKRRILLAAHWDSRFIADEDKDEDKKKNPILGADDGGSGVAVLLEIARKINTEPLQDIGVDIIFFDAEDQGDNINQTEEAVTTWCLGAQYWSRNPHVAGYRASFGILLDMVGSKDAKFTKEAVSMTYAPSTMNKMWQIAQDLGYKKYFSNQQTDGVTDDHFFVNKLAAIPMIDIINRPTGKQFGAYWHTHDDNMDIIDPKTLQAVGAVTMHTVYRFEHGQF